MKSFPKSAALSSSQQKIRISKQELERMVEQEFQRAMKRKENRLDALIEMIDKDLSHGLKYEAANKTLQTHMKAVAQKAEQALAYIAQTQTPALGETSITRSHLEAVSTKTVSQVSNIPKLLEKTKKEVERLHVEDAALKAAFEDKHVQTTRSPPNNISQPKGLIKGLAKLLHVKKDPENAQPAAEASVSVKSIKEELCPPEVDANPKRIKLELEEVPYPPLPALPFPSFLSLEATKYNIPPRLKVDLALIKKPSPQLSLVWTLDEIDLDAPPMDTYSIYLTTEVTQGSNQFDGWQKLGEHAAAPLPMFSLYTKYKLGYKICVSVVGKDKFGRYGPYSKVNCAFL
ncbi:uncharacterized protein [Eucyclogobius newberryi]|uniref:uncharacterized protein n=1 Tax=Eucyclogobius newberryi TaxID=166745 RepID=UPI003B591D0D